MRKRWIKVTCFVLIVCMAISLIPMSSAGLPSTYTIETFCNIAEKVADSIKNAGVFPSVLPEYGEINKAHFYGYALLCIEAINNEEASTTQLYRMSTETTSNITGYRDNFNQIIINKNEYLNMVARNISFANNTANGGYFAAYTTYPSAGYTHLTGNFSFTRGLYTYARILRYAKNNNYTLPDFVDCTTYSAYLSDSVQPTALVSVSDVVNGADAAINAYNAVVTNSRAASANFPTEFSISTHTLGRAEYLRTIMHALLAIKGGATKDSDKIPIYNNSSEPDGWPYNEIESQEFTKAEYMNAAERQVDYMNKNNGRLPTVVLNFKEGKNLPYTLTLIVFSRALSYYKHNGHLPNRVNYW